MLRIKRLYTFVIQTFFPIFLMTFGICLFILLMQFLWRYIEDLVGKGLDIPILGELFFYAALNLIPMGLPLAILLASLMTFGNMGERLELLAIKASGVSLLKAMRPLIIFISLVCIGAFFFQNEAMPRIGVKFRAILTSVKQKSPELDIPEGSFYSGINNYSIYVRKKDPETRILHNVMIYNTSKGFDNMSVYVCDSAKMRVSVAKDFLLLTLYSGQHFSNFRDGGINNSSSYNNKFVPYSRENFKEKEIIIPFDANFNRIDESNYDGTQISKNIAQLGVSIDSMRIGLDSANITDRRLIKQSFFTYRNNESYTREIAENNATAEAKKEIPILNFDSVMSSRRENDMVQIYESAAGTAESNKFNYIDRSMAKIDTQKRIRYHQIEWHQKFTLSFACLIFFFIGAPLGAIIRKGGLGMPVVISVIFFIIYYIFNNVGIKLARDGVWEVWQGMWLSSFILFPIGVFLTYKAMNDSALFNVEAYTKYLRKALRLRDELNNEAEDNAIDRIPDLSTFDTTSEQAEGLMAMPNDKLRDITQNYQSYGYNHDTFLLVLSILKDRGENFNDIRLDIKNYKLAKDILGDFKKASNYALLSYIGILIFFVLGRFISSDILDWVLWLTLAGYITMFTKSYICYRDFLKSLKKKMNNKAIITIVLSFACYFIMHIFVKKKMEKEVAGK